MGKFFHFANGEIGTFTIGKEVSKNVQHMTDGIARD
jgi:hypothetical protein